MKSYSELITLPTFKERFEYLKLDGAVGIETFGFDRYLNQKFYRSPEWRRVKRLVTIRDNGCDLGIDDIPIGGRIYIHHINPITIDDIKNRNPLILDPEYLISVSFDTHNAIHYGDESILQGKRQIERLPNDTCLWR